MNVPKLRFIDVVITVSVLWLVGKFYLLHPPLWHWLIFIPLVACIPFFVGFVMGIIEHVKGINP